LGGNTTILNHFAGLGLEYVIDLIGFVDGTSLAAAIFKNTIDNFKFIIIHAR